jgi:branched-chain amino acid transport system substrate-binding protein
MIHSQQEKGIMTPGYRLLTLLSAMLAAGCNSSPAPPQGSAGEATSSARPFTVGFLGALTGNFASSGKDTLDGFTLYLEQIDHTAGGRTIAVIVEDTAGAPNTALAKARKLVEQDEVDILVGPTLANEGSALRDYVDRANAPTLFPSVSSDDITQRARTPWIIRPGWTSSQPAHAFGRWLYDQGKRRAATIAFDYAFGWESVGGFQQTFEEAGGKVIQKIWTPQTTSDFAPYFPQIRKDVDAVVVAQSGGNAIRFLQQWQEFGLKGTYPLYGLAATTDEAVLKSMGDEAVGVVTVLHWSAALRTPAAREFVQSFKEQFNNAPGYRAEGGYVTAQIIADALERTDGDPGVGKALIDALRDVTISGAPRGPISFDEYGGVIENVYIRRVDRIDGELQNTVIATLPDVSQFWTYDPETFLSNPVYSRDHPGCANCQ